MRLECLTTVHSLLADEVDESLAGDISGQVKMSSELSEGASDTSADLCFS